MQDQGPNLETLKETLEKDAPDVSLFEVFEKQDLAERLPEMALNEYEGNVLADLAKLYARVDPKQHIELDVLMTNARVGLRNTGVELKTFKGMLGGVEQVAKANLAAARALNAWLAHEDKRLENESDEKYPVTESEEDEYPEMDIDSDIDSDFDSGSDSDSDYTEVSRMINNVDGFNASLRGDDSMFAAIEGIFQ